MMLSVLFGACRTSQVASVEYSDDGAYEVVLAPYQPASPRFHDLLHTRLDLAFDWQNRWVIGEANLQLKPYFYPQRFLMLDAKGFDIAACELVASANAQALEYDYDGEILTVDLGREYSRRDTFEVRISYIAKPYARQASGGRAITSDRGLFFIDPLQTDTLKPTQIWTQGETAFNSCWFPTIDSPNERFTQEIFLTVDSALTTLSNGTLQSSVFLGNGLKKDHWRLDKPHAPYLAMIAVGNFIRIEDSSGDIPLGYYVEPEYAEYAKDIFGNTPEMLNFFSQRLKHTFPWPKYDQVVVRDFVSGAMENTTASVFMEDLLSDHRELLDGHWDGIIAHELFHQWFGNLVTCESWANLALNEGFANYSEYLWNEYKYGAEEAGYGLWLEKQSYFSEAADVKTEPVVNYFYEDAEELFDSHRYSKAGAILHMLRRYVGEDAFFQSLNVYLQKNAWQAVELADLRLAFEETTGEDLQWFFEQWFEMRGHPVLEIAHQQRSDTLYIDVKQTQLSDSVGFFTFPLQVIFWAGGKMFEHDVLIDAPEQQLAFIMLAPVDLVQVDPHGDLLAEIAHDKPVNELLNQYRNGLSFSMRRDALEAIFTIGDSLAIGEAAMLAMRDPSPRLREMLLDNLSGRGHVTTEVLRKEIRRLTGDSSALVRAAAYSLYAETGAADSNDVLQAALRDSSYSVVGAGLEGLLPGYVESPPWLKQFLNIRHLNVAMPIASFYNTSAGDAEAGGRLRWFHQNLLHFRGMDRWLFLQVYVEHLILAGAGESPDVKKVLTYISSNDNHHYNRVSAFQALILVLPATEENLKTLHDIAASETDEQARTVMYSLLGTGGG